MENAELLPGEALRAEEFHCVDKGVLAERKSGFDDLFGLVAIHHHEFGAGDGLIAQVGRGELHARVHRIQENARHGEFGGQDVDVEVDDPQVYVEAEVDTADIFLKADIVRSAGIVPDRDGHITDVRRGDRIALIVQTADLQRIVAFRHIGGAVDAVEGLKRVDVLDDPAERALQPLEDGLGEPEDAVCRVVERREERGVVDRVLRQLVFLVLIVDQVHFRMGDLFVGEQVLGFRFQHGEKGVETALVPEGIFGERVAVDHDGHVFTACRALYPSGGRIHVAVVFRRQDPDGDEAEDHRHRQDDADDAFSHGVTPFRCGCDLQKFVHSNINIKYGYR